MKISKPQIVHEKNQIIYRVSVDSAGGNETLWYSLHESFANLLCNSSDAPLVALLIPAMAMGEDMYIDGAISERLHYNLSGTYQCLLQILIPTLSKVKIFAEDLLSGQSHSARGVATGFSGGIDSFSVLKDHYYSDITERYKVTHLLYNNVGSHGVGGERLFRERYDRLVPIAKSLGLPFLMINSNLDLFYRKGLRFQKTHTIRNVSVALLLQRGIGRYLYASTFNYLEAFVGPTYDMAYSDIITLPLLSTETLDALSVGSEHTRVEKTLHVAEIPDSYRSLDVCANDLKTSGFVNCSKCWKCLRTLATLEIAGLLERYSQVFDLNTYQNQREIYFSSLLRSHDPLLREIRQLAKERDYSFPFSSHLYYYTGISKMTKMLQYALRKIKIKRIKRRIS